MSYDEKHKSEFTSAVVAYVYPLFCWRKEHVAKKKKVCLAKCLHCSFKNSFSKEMKSTETDRL